MNLFLARHMKRPVKLLTGNGRDVVLVSVNKSSDKVAMIDKDDYELLISLGASPNWVTHHNRNNVLAASNTNSKVGIARVLMDCKEGEGIRYRDGNCLNLKRENLEVVADPRGKRRDREYLNR